MKKTTHVKALTGLFLLLAVFLAAYPASIAFAQPDNTEQPVVDVAILDPTDPPAEPEVPAEPTYTTGWNQMEDGNWKYYRDGAFVSSSWVVDDGKTYYVDADANMHKGWLKLDSGAYYLLPTSGVMQTGTVSIGVQNEEFADSGRYIGPKRSSGYTGWTKGGPDASWYYIRKGAITRGWQQINKSWYYMTSDGTMAANEWVQSANKWYYMSSNGLMSQGWKKVEDKWYYLMPGTGVMKSGWFKQGGIWYYLRGSGMVENSWLKLGNSWYYLNPGGRMATSWQKIEDTWYYFSPSNGTMRTGWFESGKNWYYLRGNGAMVENEFFRVGSRWYFFRAGGAMATGWAEVDGEWYYLKSGSGTMHTGWQKLGNNWYYLRSNGAMVNNGFIRIGANWYYFNKSGVMQRGWTQVVDEATGTAKWYYFKSDGTMVTGKQTIGGKDNYFTVDGEWIDYGNISKGIDVSSWQQNINWKAVKDSGMVDFALIRALRCEPTAGPNGTPRYSIDPDFESNVRQAKAQGIKIGAYLVTYAFNNEDMKKEVEMFVNSAEVQRLKADGIKFDFPIFIDIEYNGILTGNPSYESRTSVLRYGMDLLRQYGYTPGFYSNMNWANNYYNAAQLSNEGYYFWLARYPGDTYQRPEDKPSMADIKNAAYAIWQYTSSGAISGISGLVDLNFGYTNF